MPKDVRNPRSSSVGKSVGTGLTLAGRWLSWAAAGAGKSIASAYHSVDPDVRWHLAQVPLAGLSLLAARQLPVAALPADGHPPILFIHGLGGNRGNFMAMQALFRMSGRKRTYALGLDGSSELEQMAQAVRLTLKEIVRVNSLGKGARIDIVAHSMGGLVARLALEQKASRLRVRTLVTLGTPHGGTFAARFGATAHVRALRPDSEVLRRLGRQQPWHGPPRLVCLWSRSDVLLLPPTSGCLEGAENIEMPGFTHYGYLVNPLGAQAVLRALC